MDGVGLAEGGDPLGPFVADLFEPDQSVFVIEHSPGPGADAVACNSVSHPPMIDEIRSDLKASRTTTRRAYAASVPNPHCSAHVIIVLYASRHRLEETYCSVGTVAGLLEGLVAQLGVELELGTGDQLPKSLARSQPYDFVGTTSPASTCDHTGSAKAKKLRLPCPFEGFFDDGVR